MRVDETDIQVSGDGGASFESRTPPDMPLDVAFDPEDPQRMVVATQQGTFSSADEGGSWRPRDPIPTEQLAWAAPDALYRSDPGGLIKVSADGGATWKDRGNVGLPVNELAADEEGTLYASVAGRRGPPLDRRRRHLEAPATAGVARSARTRAARRPRSRPPGCRSRWR